MNAVAVTDVLAPQHHYPVHAARHRRPEPHRSWPHRVGRWAARGAFWATFAFGVIFEVTGVAVAVF